VPPGPKHNLETSATFKILRLNQWTVKAIRKAVIDALDPEGKPLCLVGPDGDILIDIRDQTVIDSDIFIREALRYGIEIQPFIPTSN
jgi:hypothetical protein